MSVRTSGYSIQSRRMGTPCAFVSNTTLAFTVFLCEQSALDLALKGYYLEPL